jgi:N-acetylmuramoyl-L-alanine amidase
MPRALLRLVCVLVGAGCAQAAPNLAVLRIGRVDYVRVTDVASRLGLALRWQGLRHVELLDPAGSIELPASGASDGREIRVHGLAVWLGEPVVARSGQAYLSRIDYEQRLVPLLQPRSGAHPAPRPRIIALDPGHGGSDSGAKNPRLGYMEKNFTLDVALRLKKVLETAGYEVVMTRTADLPSNRKLELQDRDIFANVHHADLFLSIHFNAGASDKDVTSHGTEVYTFAPAGQSSTAHWGEKVSDAEPNKEFPVMAPSLRFNSWNVVFAHAMHGELRRRLGTEDRGEKIAHWGALRSLNCPGILVESAFISNDAEGRRVATPAFREEIAETMALGIRDYVGILDSLRPLAPAPDSSPAAPKDGSSERPGATAQPHPPGPVLLPPQRPS